MPKGPGHLVQLVGGCLGISDPSQSFGYQASRIHARCLLGKLLLLLSVSRGKRSWVAFSVTSKQSLCISPRISFRQLHPEHVLCCNEIAAAAAAATTTTITETTTYPALYKSPDLVQGSMEVSTEVYRGGSKRSSVSWRTMSPIVLDYQRRWFLSS